jgi:hypothetical protein
LCAERFLLALRELLPSALRDLLGLSCWDTSLDGVAEKFSEIELRLVGLTFVG